jgi:Uma2 family endonuclease
MIAKQPIRASTHLISDLSWEEYEKLLNALGERHVPHTYADGVLELMTLTHEHEWLKKVIGRMIETAALILRVRIKSAGSMTLKRQLQSRGLEPDESYYIAREAQVRHRRQLDLRKDPPPDLAVEVDVTHKVLDRLEAYARLGVAEVWRHDKAGLRFYRLADSAEYRPAKTSLAFPQLSSADMNRFLKRLDELDENAVVWEFAEWLKKKEAI